LISGRGSDPAGWGLEICISQLFRNTINGKNRLSLKKSGYFAPVLCKSV